MALETPSILAMSVALMPLSRMLRALGRGGVIDLWHRKGSGLYLNLLPDGKVKCYYASTVTSASAITFSGTKRIVVTQTATTLTVYVDGVQFISSTQANPYGRISRLDVLPSPTMTNTQVDTLRAWIGTALDADEVAALEA